MSGHSMSTLFSDRRCAGDHHRHRSGARSTHLSSSSSGWDSDQQRYPQNASRGHREGRLRHVNSPDDRTPYATEEYGFRCRPSTRSTLQLRRTPRRCQMGTFLLLMYLIPSERRSKCPSECRSRCRTAARKSEIECEFSSLTIELVWKENLFSKIIVYILYYCPFQAESSHNALYQSAHR